MAMAMAMASSAAAVRGRFRFGAAAAVTAASLVAVLTSTHRVFVEGLIETSGSCIFPVCIRPVWNGYRACMYYYSPLI